MIVITLLFGALMKQKFLIVICIAICSVVNVNANDKNFKRPLISIKPAHTFSIIARDPKTGELGAAVQSHWFSVGSDVIWAAPGVGAVATQSFIEVSYGPKGLKLMRDGLTAAQSLTKLLAKDKHKDVRQVAMIDAHGNVVNHTGIHAIESHCEHSGLNYSVQANLMLNDQICDAMSKSFESSTGDLAEKLLLALEAAQKQGGDIRGRQSAAILVVKGNANIPIWKGRVFDLRVEDNSHPISELRRLLTMARGYHKMTEGDDFMTEGKVENALKAYKEAEKMMPNNHEALFWHAATLAAIGRVNESLPLFKKAFKMHPNWRKLVPRLPKSGLLPNDDKLIKTIVNLK